MKSKSLDEKSGTEFSLDEIQEFRDSILEWGELNRRIFPWRRKHESHYRLVVTELLLQRTKAETVAKHHSIFFTKFPTWNHLAAATEDSIGEYIKPLGLWRRRAPVLRQLASVMVKRNGRFPSTRKELDALPGVGQYVGNAIELLCQDRAKPLLDAGMARVLERYFGSRKLADIRYDPYLQDLSQRVVEHEYSRELNWTILDFAALVCKKNIPLCTFCMLKKGCQFVRSNLSEVPVS